MPDGLSCLVSFLDFQNSTDVVALTSLRPFPIIAWVSKRLQMKSIFTYNVLFCDKQLENVCVSQLICRRLL